jgi:hypothetical protein
MDDTIVLGEAEVRRNKLYRLAKFVCEDLHVTFERFYNQYARNEVSTARHVYVLVATDLGFSYNEVASVLRRDPSFITQVRRRKFALRTTIEYLHAKQFMEQLLKREREALANAKNG